MNIPRISSAGDVEAGAIELIKADGRFGEIIQSLSPLPLRKKPAGFATLLEAIVGQQITTAAARAIWRRLEDAGLTDEHAVECATPEDLQCCGLSKPKVRYAMALACANVDWDELNTLDEMTVINRLTRLPGVGKWTAEVYALQALGLADAFPAGDMAMQEGAKLAFGLDARPSETELRQMSAQWRPWRSIAARALWAYYGREKKREGI